jgi:hypothetical protein
VHTEVSLVTAIFERWKMSCRSKRSTKVLARNIALAMARNMLPAAFARWKMLVSVKHAIAAGIAQAGRSDEFWQQFENLESEVRDGKVTIESLTRLSERLKDALEAARLQISALERRTLDEKDERTLLRQQNTFLLMTCHHVISSEVELAQRDLEVYCGTDHNVAQLALPNEPLRAVAELPAEELIFRWFNSSLKSKRKLGSFAADFRDSEMLIAMVHYVFPELQQRLRPLLEIIDFRDRGEKIAQIMQSLPFPLGSVVSAENIYLGVSDMNAAVACSLMLDYPSMRPPPTPATARIGEDIGEILQLVSETTGKGDFSSRMAASVEARDQFIHLVTAFGHLRPRVESIRTHQREIDAIWQVVLSKLNCFLREVFAARMAGKPREVVDLRKDQARLAYSRVSHKRLDDVYKLAGADVPQQQDEIQRVLFENCDELKKIFKFYSRGTGGHSATGMAGSEFLKFVQDCRLLNKSLTKDVVNLIHLKSMTATEGAEVPGGKAKNSLTAQRWLESIVRLAQKMYIDTKAPGNTASWTRTVVTQQARSKPAQQPPCRHDLIYRVFCLDIRARTLAALLALPHCRCRSSCSLASSTPTHCV